MSEDQLRASVEQFLDDLSPHIERQLLRGAMQHAAREFLDENDFPPHLQYLFLFTTADEQFVADVEPIELKPNFLHTVADAGENATPLDEALVVAMQNDGWEQIGAGGSMELEQMPESLSEVAEISLTWIAFARLGDT